MSLDNIIIQLFPTDLSPGRERLRCIWGGVGWRGGGGRVEGDWGLDYFLGEIGNIFLY